MTLRFRNTTLGRLPAAFSDRLGADRKLAYIRRKRVKRAARAVIHIEERA